MADDRLLPASLRSDPSAQVYNLLGDRLGNMDIAPLLVYLIDTVPAAVLPYLAEQFHVLGHEGWLLATTDLKRRALLKVALELHRYKGTPWAVERVLESLDLEGSLEEWWQYAGTPYHFRITVTLRTTTAPTLEWKRRLAAMIYEWKNLRSRGEIILISAYAFRAGHSRCGDRLGFCETAINLETLL